MGWEHTIQDDEPASVAASEAAPAAATSGWESTIEDEAPPAAPDEPGHYQVKDPLSATQWWEAAKDTWKNPDPSARAAMSGGLPLAAGEAGGALVGAGAQAAGKLVTQGAESLATSPRVADALGRASSVMKKIAERTDVAGKAASKIFGDAIPDSIKGLVGRSVTYNTPGLRWAQAGSDAALGAGKAADTAQKGVQVAQKGLAWMLDNAPDSLGNLLPAVQKAAASGPKALATVEFLLSQKSPEYQEITKRQRNNEQ